MRNPTICIGENKDTDQLPGICEADQRLFFATRKVQSLFFLNLKCPASRCLLCLYSLVCDVVPDLFKNVGFLMRRLT